MQEKTDIIIVGGGITGLCIAYLTAKAGKKVKVVEASKSFGGLLSTFEAGGSQLEHYYHHFFTHDAEILWLIRELGIEINLVFEKTSMGVFRNGEIFDFNSPKDLLRFKPLGLFDKFRFGASSFFLGKFANWRKNEKTSTLDWFNRWAGKNVTRSIWGPLLKIKFGPFAHLVPLAWMIGRLRQRLNSREQGEEKLGYLKGSLNILLQALLKKLNEMGVELIGECPVTGLEMENAKLKGIETAKGKFFADKIVMTIPSPFISKILAPTHPALSKKAAEVQYFGAVCTILEMKNRLSHIYWLNVADEGFPFGGVIEHTNFISQTKYNNTHIAYLSRYFAHSEEIAKMSNAEIETLMLASLPRLFPTFNQNMLNKVHVFKTMYAATVCDLNFSEKVMRCESPIEGLYIANMMHIYPDERSVNNSIRLAAETTRVMGMNSDFVPKGNSMSAQIGFD